MPALLDQAINELEAIDPSELSDAALHRLVIQVEKAQSRFIAAQAQLLASWDTRRLWANDGSKAAWGRLSRECALSPATTKWELGRSRRLSSMPATSAALRAGTLSIDQADLLRYGNQPALAELFARDELLLISEIKPLSLRAARRAVDYWIEKAHEELGLDRPYRSREGRHLKVARTFQGTVDIRGLLDELAGTEVLTELERIERQLFERDWAEVRAEHGDVATSRLLPRTRFQRMADALQQMARNSAGFRAGVHREPRPLITIHAGRGAFGRMCELADGTVIAPGRAVPYLCEGDVERIVFDGPSRVIDVGVRQRFFTGALRRAIQVRDRHCTHESGCEVPAEDCDVDHIVEYARGGQTTQENGRCHCRTHNLGRNEPGDPDPRPPPKLN